MTLIALLSASCEKGVLKVGSDLLPAGDFVSIKSIDTLKVFSYTAYNDSIRTNNPSVSYLGQEYDPYFGTTTAEFVTQVRLGGRWNPVAFTIDSVKMNLHILTYKNVTSDAIHYLRISEISDQIYTDSAYYSSTPIHLTGYVLPDITIPAKLKNDTNLVVKLPVEFGNYLTRDTSQLFYSNAKPDFRSYFKGLYFQIVPSADPMFLSLTVAPPSIIGNYTSSIEIYLHDSEGASFVYPLIFDATNRNAAFNRFVHDYTTAVSGDKMIHRNTNYLDTLSYLQSLNGVFTRVIIPGLERIKNDPAYANIAVNKARITVPVYFNGNQYKPSTVPPQLALRYKTTTGIRYYVPDWNIETSNHTFFDGKIDSVLNVYRFNIPAFVQAYLKDATNTVKPELEIFQSTELKNVILKANKSKTPVKFEFTYTKF